MVRVLVALEGGERHGSAVLTFLSLPSVSTYTTQPNSKYVVRVSAASLLISSLES